MPHTCQDELFEELMLKKVNLWEEGKVLSSTKSPPVPCHMNQCNDLRKQLIEKGLMGTAEDIETNVLATIAELNEQAVAIRDSCG